MSQEDLIKSIDAQIDALFAEEESTEVETSESVEKSMIKDEKPQSETADEAVSKAPASQKDEARSAGRPKQISEIPQKDQDGKRDGKYDDDIAEDNKDGKTKEQDQVEPPKDMKKSWEDSEEYKEYQELKKAKAEQEKAENIKKAKEETADLIKSAVEEATKGIKAENEALKKSLEETSDLIKAMANKPRASKAVTSMSVLEKSFSGKEKQESLSKSELLDVAEDLVKAKKISVDHLIELENNGFIFEDDARNELEKEVKRRYS